MSFLLRDPLVRGLLMADCGRDEDRSMCPRRQCQHLRRQPFRVRRDLDDVWPLAPFFGQALSELQSVMENVSEAIGQYQNSPMKDLPAGGMRTQRTEDGNFQVAIDVAQFKPEEVSVKLCDDNLVVEAKTETSANDSYHKAEFKRSIRLPQDVKQDAIRSTLTADKKLLIEVPMNKPIQANSCSRSIPIEVQKEPLEEGKQQQQAPESQQGNDNQTQVKN